MRVCINNTSVLVDSMLGDQVGVPDESFDARSLNFAHLVQLVWHVFNCLSEEEIDGTHFDGRQEFAQLFKYAVRCQ